MGFSLSALHERSFVKSDHRCITLGSGLQNPPPQMTAITPSVTSPITFATYLSYFKILSFYIWLFMSSYWTPHPFLCFPSPALCSLITTNAIFTCQDLGSACKKRPQFVCFLKGSPLLTGSGNNPDRLISPSLRERLGDDRSYAIKY